MIKIKISNDPLVGLERSVNLVSFDWNLRSNFIKLNLEVVYDTIPNEIKRIPNYFIELVSDNSTFVNENGEFIEYETLKELNENGEEVEVTPVKYINSVTKQAVELVGQYEYFTSLANKGACDIVGLIVFYIKRADILHKFDI